MTEPESSAPALGASDAGRERAAELLRQAMASGRLNVDELGERMSVLGSIAIDRAPPAPLGPGPAAGRERHRLDAGR